MAVTTKVYGLLASHLAAGDVAWVGGSFKISLHTSSYTPNQDTDEFFAAVTNELAGSGGYTSGGEALSGLATSYDAANNRQIFDAADVVFASLTPSGAFRYAVVRKDTGSAATDILVAYVDFGANQDPAGLDFDINWAATGVFYMQAA